MAFSVHGPLMGKCRVAAAVWCFEPPAGEHWGPLTWEGLPQERAPAGW